MSKFKFELNRDGVRELLQCSEIQEILKEHANSVKTRAGEGFTSDIYVGRNRANAMIRAESPKAKRSNLKHNTLLKALLR